MLFLDYVYPGCIRGLYQVYSELGNKEPLVQAKKCTAYSVYCQHQLTTVAQVTLDEASARARRPPATCFSYKPGTEALLLSGVKLLGRR